MATEASNTAFGGKEDREMLNRLTALRMVESAIRDIDTPRLTDHHTYSYAEDRCCPLCGTQVVVRDPNRGPVCGIPNCCLSVRLFVPVRDYDEARKLRRAERMMNWRAHR
jgi:hypothetical protein